MQLTFATRPSALARWQTQWVITTLQALQPGLICKEHLITTQGDKILNKPLPEIGGKGLFTTELENELMTGRVQVSVHSLKDLPVDSSPGLIVAAIPKRGEPRDVIISRDGYTLGTLPEGAIVGTSSLRRAAQVRSLRPNLKIIPLRGNVDTRVRKVIQGQYDAAILAGAGLERLGLTDHIRQWLSMDSMLPAPGQGALAVQCRVDDHQTLSLLASIDDPLTRAAVTAERQFLARLGGGCAVPVGAFGRSIVSSEQLLQLDGLIASVDGSRVIRVSGIGIDPIALGISLAENVISKGGAEILEELQ